MRTHFFRLIQSNEIPSDIPFYLDMLKALTENGREIHNFEEEIGIFLLRWMDQIIAGKSALTLVNNSHNIQNSFRQANGSVFGAGR